MNPCKLQHGIFQQSHGNPGVFPFSKGSKDGQNRVSLWAPKRRPRVPDQQGSGPAAGVDAEEGAQTTTGHLQRLTLKWNFVVNLMEFYSDFMGLYSDFMGLYSDFVEFYSDCIYDGTVE